MGLIGLVRLTGDAEEAERQHELLDPICIHVLEETASRRRVVPNRPQLMAALDHLRPGDLLAVARVKYLARDTVDGLETLSHLSELGIAVKILTGLGAGGHTIPSSFLDDCRELADLGRAIHRNRIKAGIRRARERGTVIGRPAVVDSDKLAEILARREQGESICAIAQAVRVSVGTVHNASRLTRSVHLL